MMRLGVLLLCSVALGAPNGPMTEQDAADAFFAAHSAKDWKQAIKACKQWERINSRSPLAAYNHACALSLDGQKDEAAKKLLQAIDLGFSNIQHLKSDADFAEMRTHKGFMAAVEKLRAKEQEIVDKAIEVDPIVVLPPDHKAGKAAPLIVALHGYGQEPDDIVAMWKKAAGDAGAILVAPRGTAPLRSGGFQWRTPTAADSIAKYAMEFVGKKHIVDEKKVVLTGFSQGGYMAFNIGMQSGKRFCGVIPVAGRFVPETAGEPRSFPAKLPKFYLITGEHDNDKASNELAKTKLSSYGADVMLKVYPGLGHAFPDDPPTELGKALNFVMR